jgi:hypothetical protein
MDWAQYFEAADGLGVLSTTDADGRVNAAVYSRPHIMEDGSAAFIMPDRLTHQNLQANARAVYLFVEAGSKSRGVRLYLEKNREEGDAAKIAQLRRTDRGDPGEPRFLVYFTVTHTRPLVGG